MQLLAFSPPRSAHVEKFSMQYLTGLWVWHAPSPGERILLYLHGGGYAIGSAQFYLDFAYRLSVACKAKVLVIDYRLAPEHPLPAALEDSLLAYHWLCKQYSPQQIILAGDSAGGGLVLSLLLAIIKQNQMLPKAGLCFSPWTDLACQHPSITSNAHLESYLVIPKNFDFLGAAKLDDPLFSPIYAELTGLPPLLIQVGSNEILHDDAALFAAKAQQAGVKVDLQIWNGVPHVWQLFARFVPEARQAIAAAGKFLDEL